MTTLERACAYLREGDDFLILTHTSPDGDTLGSASALCRALRAMGKRANIACSDPIPQKYSFLVEPDLPEPFAYRRIVSVDVADVQLLGDALAGYGDRIELCIDHHPSNCIRADIRLLDTAAAAAAEVVYELIRALGVTPDRQMAIQVYTGISTDSGCFRFSNTTARTHRIAAELFELGIDHTEIDRRMFETQSRGYVALEQQVLASIEYHFDGLCALVAVTREMLEQSGVSDSELDGIAQLPRQIEGVEVGATLKQKQDGEFRVSLRTNRWLNASEICERLGGGGHVRAAGCRIHGDLAGAKRQLLEAIGAELAKRERPAV